MQCTIELAMAHHTSPTTRYHRRSPFDALGLTTRWRGGCCPASVPPASAGVLCREPPQLATRALCRERASARARACKRTLCLRTLCSRTLCQFGRLLERSAARNAAALEQSFVRKVMPLRCPWTQSRYRPRRFAIDLAMSLALLLSYRAPQTYSST